MPHNNLAGSGPVMPGGQSDGPPASLAGTLGVAPQASPQPAPQNMLSAAPAGPGAAPSQAAPQSIVPPSKEMLMEALTKSTIISAELKGLLGKPNLSTRDVINTVGEIVADQVMSPFQAAQYLQDLPASGDSLQLRQWIGAHYAKSAQTIASLQEMMSAHGAATRQGRMTPPAEPATSAVPSPAVRNQLTGFQ